MCVSENRGTPKSSILIGFSIRNHPFWGTPIFGNTHLYVTRKKADKRAWNFLQQIVLVLGVGNSSCWVFICETCPWFRSMELWFKSMTRNGRHTPAEKYKPTHPEPENEKFCFGNVSKMKHTKFSRGWLLDIWLFRAPGASSEPVSKTTWRCWKQFHDKFQPPVHTKSTQLESTNRSKIWSLSKNIEDKIFLFFLRWFCLGGGIIETITDQIAVHGKKLILHWFFLQTWDTPPKVQQQVFPCKNGGTGTWKTIHPFLLGWNGNGVQGQCLAVKRLR